MARWQNNPDNFVLRTREAAASEGRKLYFTGKPCGSGHTAPRYVSTGGCLACLTRFQAQGAKNPHSHDLVPYIPIAPFWRSKRLSPEQLAGLDRYVQQCVVAYCEHVLPPLCKACDGTLYVFVPGAIPPRKEACTACARPEPSTADSVPTGTGP